VPSWQRTLYTLWVTQFIAVAGFSFVTPFVPYYIQELGITDVRQVGLWAGLVTSAQAISMTLIGRASGSSADCGSKSADRPLRPCPARHSRPGLARFS
jgi:DHA1 family multidrug resistance protein-like MFS transporter